jgi:hypothetical protein
MWSKRNGARGHRRRRRAPEIPPAKRFAHAAVAARESVACRLQPTDLALRLLPLVLPTKMQLVHRTFLITLILVCC